MSSGRTAKRTSSANGNGGSGWITKSRRLALYLRDGFVCVYCGRDMHDDDPFNVTLDHLVCRAGTAASECDHSNENLVSCCRRCNSSRQDRPWRQFAPGGSQDRIEALIAKPVSELLAKALLKQGRRWPADDVETHAKEV